MKIAILGLSSNTGGVETFVINIYRQLKKDGHKFYFLTSEDYICFEEEINKNGDKIIRYCPRKKSIFKLRKDLKNFFNSNNIDVFWYNCCSLSSIAELKIAHSANVPIRIVHSHNSKNMGNLLTLILHYFNKLIVDKYITHSFACSVVAAQWMYPKKVYKNTTVFHNAINSSKFKYNPLCEKEMRKKFSISNDTTIIGHVGRFHFQKNHMFLIDVFNEFLKEHPNSILILCGDGELRDKISERIMQYNLKNNILLLGNQNDMQNMYQLFNIMVFPSLFEGLPFVLVEAQAAGIPCLISNTISDEIVLTDLIEFEDLNHSARIWAEKMNVMIKKGKKNTTEEIIKNGYDIRQNCSDFYQCIGKERNE